MGYFIRDDRGAAGPSSGRSRAIAAVFFLAVGLLCGCSRPVEPAESPATAEFLNMGSEVQYVGMDACRQCHLEKYSTYSHTGMGRAFYKMSHESAVEDFTVNNEFTVEPYGVHYRMEERGGKYFQRQFVRDSSGREMLASEHEMVWVVGSNNHARSYLTDVDGGFFQAPACWYPQESKWELCPGYEFNNEHFTREIGPSCLHCHNGKMELAEGTRNRFEEPLPLGIDCERCHGPGQLHVERWRGDDTPTGNLDPTIVNPRRLPAAERMEVCFQCHLGDAKATERVRIASRDFGSFRPGEKITSVVVPFRYKQQTEWDFGLSAQADRMLLSKCFEASGGKLECLTCHNPHISVYDEGLPDDFYRQRCTTCHAPEACAAPDAQRQATRPVADNCIDCHMRRAEPDDQRFTEFTDHWIRRDVDLDEPDHRSDYDIEPLFPERFAHRSAGEQDFYRAQAIALLARDAPASARPDMWRSAVATFESAIDKGHDTVDAWYHLGKIRKHLGLNAESAEAFQAAFDKDPTHHDAAYAVGQALLAQGHAEPAMQIFEAMLERDPDDPLALAEAGRGAMALGDAERAIELLGRAVEVEPWTADMHLNLGRALASVGRMDEAAQEGVIAATIDPDEIRVWEFYENVMLAAGRPRDAAEGRIFRERLQRSAAATPRPAPDAASGTMP